MMGINKLEVNFRRLLRAAPQQQNQAKLMHYVQTLREQLEQLSEEKTPDGLPRISKGLLGDYMEKIEAIASKLVVPSSDMEEYSEPSSSIPAEERSFRAEPESPILASPGLRRRSVPPAVVEDRYNDNIDCNLSEPVKLDAEAQAHIDKHRKLQEDLTDEMVELAQQLKESSLMMNRSLQNTEKILDSTEKSIEHSLASTGRANKRAIDVYSKTSKTTCFTWLVLFAMTCVFIMVVLLIRVT